MNPAVIVTEAPPGVPASAIGCLATTDLTTVAITPRQSHATSGGVAGDLLQALGKSHDANGRARHATDDIILAPIWLTAHRTTRLLVIAPQHTPTKNLLDLLDIASASPSTVWFACDNGYAAHFLAQLSAASPATAPWPHLTSREAGTPEAVATWRPEEARIIPNTEFLIFYATTRRLLSAADFVPVDDLFRSSLTRTMEWISLTGTANILESATRAALTTLVAEQATMDQITIALKAAQAAFFRNGWYLSIDWNQLTAGLVRFPTPHVETETWRRIRAYRDTARAATVALYLSGLAVQQIEALTVEELATWQGNPTALLKGASISTEPAVYLRAHLLERATKGKAPSDLAFEGARRRVRMDLRQAVDDLGINLGEGVLDTSTHGQARINTRVFRIERLAA